MDELMLLHAILIMQLTNGIVLAYLLWKAVE